MNLPDFIRQNIEDILQEWEKHAFEIQPESGSLNIEELRDHAEKILFDIATGIDRSRSKQFRDERSRGIRPLLGQALNSASEHGITRHGFDFSISDVLSEYRALRTSVTRLWIESRQEDPNWDEILLFNEELDGVIKEAVEAFTAAADKQRRLLEAERKGAEKALRESEEKFRSLFEKGPIGVAFHKMVYDDSGKAIDYRFLDANPSYLELTGVDPRGKYVTEAFPGIEDDPFDWIGTFGRVAKTGEQIRFEQYLQTNKRWYDCVGYQVKPDYFVAAFVEITKRKQAEEALETSEYFHRQILESIPGLVFTTRPDGYCDYQSRQWVDYTGIPVSEHYGDGWNKLLHPDDRSRALASWRAAVHYDEPYQLEYRVRRFDGVYEWFRVIGSPIRDDESGKIVRWFGVAMNIEALKQGETDLQKLNETLEQRVADRTVKLRDLTTRVFRLEQNERKKLARFLHDEIQQLLVAVKIKVEYAQQAVGAREKARNLLADSLRQLNDTIANTRTMSMEMAPTLFFETGVTVCLEWLERWAKQTLGLRIKTHVYGEERPIAEEGGYLIYRFLRELLFNVYKHAATNEAEITVTFLTGGSITFSVEDKGKGFNPYLLQKNPVKGVGLSSMTEQINALGGDITIQAKLTVGARIDISIPSEFVGSRIKQDTTQTDKIPQKQNSKERSGNALLIVDDQEDLRFTLKFMLEDLTEDLHLLEAKSGQEAIEMMRSHLPDVILMDVSMPVMSGIEATKAIRKEFETVPIIGLSMHDAEDMEKVMKEAGAQDFICKNSPVEMILDTVKKYLE